MIAILSGKVTEKIGEVVVVDCAGVGYGVLLPYADFEAVTVGEPVKLYVYEHIRENSHDLFGFRELPTKKLFEQLLSVNGVGPKMALSIMSISTPDHVKQAIAGGDTKFIARANGVGKRVSERIVVDLKDKVGLMASSDATGFLSASDLETDDEAFNGLLSLGYNAADAAEALKSIDKKLPAEERIKLALKSRF